MYTVNISLPPKLRDSALSLIEQGYYASFSDVVRDSLRQLLERQILENQIREVKAEEAQGEAVVLKSGKEIEAYFKKL